MANAPYEPSFNDIREAHEKLARVGIAVNVVDKYVITITNLDQKPMRLTREQARELGKALPFLAELNA